MGDIVARLTDGSSKGVFIVGEQGSGKTWLLGQVQAALGPTTAVIKLSPSKALSHIPLGAVNARIGADLARSGDYYEVLNGLVKQVQAGLKSADRVLLIVDNERFLDEQSAAVIVEVLMSTDAKIIVVENPGQSNSFLRQLRRDGQLSRFEVQPLPLTEVQLFLEDALDDSVSQTVAGYFASRSGGNPLMLKGLIAGALEEGSLRRKDNVWVLGRSGDTLGAEVADYLRTDLESMGGASLRIVEVLALAGPLPLDVLIHLEDESVLDDLEQAGLVTAVASSPLTIKLSRGATAKTIRELVPIGRSRRLFEELSAIFEPNASTAPDLFINFVRWSIQCGARVSDARILQAAHKASNLLRSADVLLFGKHEIGPEQAAELLALTAMAERNNNSYRRARVNSQAALEAALTPDAGVLALEAIHLAFLTDNDYQATFVAATKTYEQKFGEVVLDSESRRADAQVHFLTAQAEVSWGDTHSALQRISELMNHPIMDNRTDRTALNSLLCEIYCIVGQTRQAAELGVEVILELEGPGGFDRTDLALTAYSRAVSALICDCDWSSVHTALAPEVFVSPELMLASDGMRQLGLAMMNSRRGFIEEALTQLIPAVAALSDHDPFAALPTALGLLAYCQAMRGDFQAAQQSVERLENLDTRSHKFLEIEAKGLAGAAIALSGERQRGVEQLKAMVNECQINGYYGSELWLLSLLIRVGESSHADRLAELAEILDGSSIEFYSLWAKALQLQEAPLLERASELAVKFGFELIAVELAANAQQKYQNQGETQKGRNTASKVVAIRGSRPGIATPVFGGAGRAQMTRRENEIAVLVARGESNNNIATLLNVSLRTVEGHLYRTFIKLDLHSREELAALINNPPRANTWADNESVLRDRLLD